MKSNFLQDINEIMFGMKKQRLMYCVLANQMFGIANSDLPRNPILSAENIENNLPQLCNSFAQFINDYDVNIEDKDNVYGLYVEYSDFAKNHKIRTTSKAERVQRIEFLNSIIERAVENGNE